jgi:hypothetical protein
MMDRIDLLVLDLNDSSAQLVVELNRPEFSGELRF